MKTKIKNKLTDILMILVKKRKYFRTRTSCLTYLIKDKKNHVDTIK